MLKIYLFHFSTLHFMQLTSTNLYPILKIVKKRNMGFLLVSHDMPLVETICDEKIYLKDINGV